MNLENSLLLSLLEEHFWRVSMLAVSAIFFFFFFFFVFFIFWVGLGFFFFVFKTTKKFSIFHWWYCIFGGVFFLPFGQFFFFFFFFGCSKCLGWVWLVFCAFLQHQTRSSLLANRPSGRGTKRSRTLIDTDFRLRKP